MTLTRIRRTWHGDEIEVRAERAVGRALIGNAEQHARHASEHVHRISGDLARSIHAAMVDTMGDIPADGENIIRKDHVRTIEIGSWLAYACVEENRGGEHSYMQPAHEFAWRLMGTQLKEAFRQEGLA